MSDIHVVSTGRNAGQFVSKCIESVKSQTLLPTSHVVIDDVSDDITRDVLEEYNKRQDLPYLEIVFNTERQYRLKNIYDNSVFFHPEDIVVIVDSDDWLAHDNVLSRIKEVYDSNPKLEYVYSNNKFSHDNSPGGCQKIPNNYWNPYTGRWITSHISTFKVKTLASLPIKNFLDWDGNWFRMATDHAYILPILYRLWQRDGNYSAVHFIDEIFYVYHFYNNPSKPRTGIEGKKLSDLSVRCANFIKQRGFVS